MATSPSKEVKTPQDAASAHPRACGGGAIVATRVENGIEGTTTLSDAVAAILKVQVEKSKEIHAESAPSVFWTTFFWQPSDAQASYQSFSLLTKLRVAATPM